MKLTVLMDNSYSWEGTPYIALNEQQLLHLATRFDISLAKAKEVVVAHEDTTVFILKSIVYEHTLFHKSST